MFYPNIQFENFFLFLSTTSQEYFILYLITKTHQWIVADLCPCCRITYFKHGKSCWAKCLWFRPHWSFAEVLLLCLGQNCLLFSTIKERHLYLWENLCSTPENHEKHESLAQRFFYFLQYIYVHIYIYKNNLKIMILKRGVGIDHCYKK